MQPRLDTAVLLAEGRDGAPPARVLFLVHRAADGWLGLDLTGRVTDRFLAGGGRVGEVVEVVRGGESFPDRILALYALDLDPESCGGLRVPSPGGARFGLGGDVGRLLGAAMATPGPGRIAPPRIRFFRGLSAIPRRSRSVPRGSIVVRATPELVFERRPAELWGELRKEVASCP